MNRVTIPEVPKERVLATVASFYKVDLWEKTNRREVVFPRQVAMSMLHVFTKLGLKSIGQEFGVDHATVIHSKKTVWGLCKYYPEVRNEIIHIETQLE